jgi:hypothetical protein
MRSSNLPDVIRAVRGAEISADVLTVGAALSYIGVLLKSAGGEAADITAGSISLGIEHLPGGEIAHGVADLINENAAKTFSPDIS